MRTSYHFFQWKFLCLHFNGTPWEQNLQSCSKLKIKQKINSEEIRKIENKNGA